MKKLKLKEKNMVVSRYKNQSGVIAFIAIAVLTLVTIIILRVNSQTRNFEKINRTTSNYVLLKAEAERVLEDAYLYLDSFPKEPKTIVSEQDPGSLSIVPDDCTPGSTYCRKFYNDGAPANKPNDFVVWSPRTLADSYSKITGADYDGMVVFDDARNTAINRFGVWTNAPRTSDNETSLEIRSYTIIQYLGETNDISKVDPSATLKFYQVTVKTVNQDQNGLEKEVVMLQSVYSRAF